VADYLKPIGFWSYTSSDDIASGGRLSQLRLVLAQHLQLRIGREPKVYIFQDVAAIPYGTDWLREIHKALDASSFMIPIVTPAFLQSPMCCQEVMHFRAREAALGRDDLIFPLHYIDVDDVDESRPDEVHDPHVLALSIAPTFCATAVAIHWLSETPSSLARRAAAALIEAASFNGHVALLIIAPPPPARQPGPFAGRTASLCGAQPPYHLATTPTQDLPHRTTPATLRPASTRSRIW
jgi:F-box protein 11